MHLPGNYEIHSKTCRCKDRSYLGGYEDLCADGVPVLRPVKEVPGLLLACAFTGHGFGISPIVGKLLSELAMGKETTLDLHELRYDRFQAVI